MKKYQFNGDEIEVSNDVAIEDVISAWKETHPSLANATYTENEDGTVVFSVVAGTKG
jgi:hypothetical protein